jgi:hypothetical protein
MMAAYPKQMCTAVVPVMHDVRAGIEQVAYLFIDCRRVGHGGFGVVGVIVVLCLLGHGERPRHRHFHRPVGLRLEEFQVVDFHRMAAAYFADDARYRVRVPGAVERRAWIVDVHAIERGGEAVGITLAADLTVGDDVESCLLLFADRDLRGIVLRFAQPRLGDAPQFAGAHPRRKASRQLLAVDQPLGLGVTADQHGGE